MKTSNELLKDVGKFLRDGALDRALETARTIRTTSPRHSLALRAVIGVQLIAGAADKALELAKEVPDQIRRDEAFRQIVKHHAKCEEFDKARHVLSLVGPTVAGIKAHTVLARRMVEQTQCEEAVEVFNAAFGLLPRQYDAIEGSYFGALAAGLSRASEFPQRRSLLIELFELVLGFQEAPCENNNHLVRARASVAQSIAATPGDLWRIVFEVSSKRRSHGLTVMVRALGRSRRFDALFEILQTDEEPDRQRRLIATPLASAMAEACARDVQTVLNRLSGPELPEVRYAVATELARNGDPDRALELMSPGGKPTDRGPALAMIARALARQGCHKRARAIAEQIEHTRDIGDPDKRDSHLSDLADTFEQ